MLTDGVYPAHTIEDAIERGIICASRRSASGNRRSSTLQLPDREARQLQPASLDLRLGDVAYRLRSSFLPGKESVEAKVERYSMGEVDIRDGEILERNRPYLVPLVEELALPPNVRAKANPKSSTGRLDIFTRVITDRGSRFDVIEAGYRGRLYLEVFSRTFTVKVQAGQSLNQLRLLEGQTLVDDEQIRRRHREEPLVRLGGKTVADGALRLSSGLFLSLDLQGGERGFVGYRAKKNSRLLDLTSDHRLNPDHFWERVEPEPSGDRLILEPEEFYLLMSKEAVSIPPDLSAEMTPYDPTSGELRTHYAGFFDPGFGHWEAGAADGARAVLEVRAHDVPFVVEDGQPVCKLVFDVMRERPEVLYGKPIGSSYQSQDDFLSRHFLNPRESREQLRLGAADRDEDTLRLWEGSSP